MLLIYIKERCFTLC